MGVLCGHDWCASGKAESFAWDKPKRSDALTPEQQEILKQRGNLSPDEIHKLAYRGKKAACHSDNVADEN